MKPNLVHYLRIMAPVSPLCVCTRQCRYSQVVFVTKECRRIVATSKKLMGSIPLGPGTTIKLPLGGFIHLRALRRCHTLIRHCYLRNTPFSIVFHSVNSPMECIIPAKVVRCKPSLDPIESTTTSYNPSKTGIYYGFLFNWNLVGCGTL